MPRSGSYVTERTLEKAKIAIAEGREYECRISSLRNIADKLEQFIAGEKVGR